MNCTLSNNTAGYGGGIWNFGILNIVNSTFTSNNATHRGGAIRTWGTLTITGSNFVKNSATENSGAISNYQGTTTAHFNRFIANSSNDINSESGSVNALNNWWGTNTSPSGRVSGTVNTTTWLVLTITVNPNAIHPLETSTVTSDLTHDQNGIYYNPVSGHVPDGIPLTFGGTLGTLNPTTTTIINGIGSSTFTAGIIPGTAILNSTVDNQTVNTSLRTDAKAIVVITQTVNGASTGIQNLNVGDKVTYLITANNNGPNTVTQINIKDIIPVGLTGLIITPSVGTYNSTSGIWNIPTITSGSNAVLNITGIIGPTLARVKHN